ncbi:hypothetical protein C6495_00995 [Candidatus Poribacteria bacterium]|nr:MAG: hypothetical protein C6495_00995 [Candidatus Poribacteria bacterium]
MSKSTVTTSDEKELARAVKNKVDLIIVEFDLAKKVFRIKATGKVAWAIAIGAIIAVIAMIVGTSGLAIPLATTTFGMPAVGILGWPAAVAAVKIALAGRGSRTLNKLRREYEVVEYKDNRLVLRRK